MPEQLGSAELETGVDLKGLDAGLARAETRVAKSVAVMQAMLDRLHADVDVRGAAIEAAAARMAGVTIPSTGGPTGQSVSSSTVRQSGSEVWGVRGPLHAGSLQNPIVTVMAASKFYPMGSYGAAVGESNQSDEQRGDSGFATTADMAALTAAVADMARNANPVNGLATAGQQGMTEPGAAERTVVTLDRQNGDALARAATAMESIAASTRSSTQDNRSLLTAVRSGDPAAQRILMGFPHGSSTTGTRPGTEGVTAADAALLASALRAAAVARGAAPSPVNLTSAEAAKRLGVAPTRVYYLAGSGDLAGARKVHGAWQIPESSVAAYMAASAAGAGAGGGGVGGGGVIPVAFGAGGRGGGNNGPGLLPALLWGGGGLLGLAGMGSLASFAGLGPEHLLMTVLGILGSAGTAVGGAGVLGLGAAGVMGAGMAADASGIGQAANDIKSVVQAQNNLSQAVAVYGKGSRQATVAQKELNAALAGFSPIARQAVLQAANTAQAFHQAFNQATGPAEAVGASILNQGMRTGMAFLPSLGQAALTDANLIKQGLQPLFTWLRGPEGIGIFQNLEYEFSHQLPFAVNAGTNGLEALLRIVNIASQDTGGFTKHVDELLKRLNGMSDLQLEQEIHRLIGDFRVWEAFFKALGTDIFRLFNNDVGTGRSIIQTLTTDLQHLGKVEDSISGRQSLMTMFTVHKNEIEALLHFLPLLVDPLTKLYMTVAPAATTALTDLAKGFTAVVKAIESIPGGSWLLAIGLITARLGIAGKLLLGARAASPAGGAAGAAAGVAEGAGAGAAASRVGGLLGLLGRNAAGAAVAGGVETGALGLAGAAEGAGLAGLAGAITSAGIAIAPVAAGLLPLLAAAGGVYGLVKLFGLFSGGSAPTTSYNSRQLTRMLQSGQGGVLSRSAIQGRSTSSHVIMGARGQSLQVGGAPTVKDIADTKAMTDALKRWYDVASKSTNVSKMNAAQLAAMAREGDRLATVFPKDAQLIDKLNAPIKTTLAGLRDVFKVLTDRWHTDLHSGLGRIKDDFSSNLRLIASQIGLSSHEGEQAWKKSLDNMVRDVTTGMLHGKIAVEAGMGAITKATEDGVKGQAISWQQKGQLILGSIDALYRAGKLSPREYYSELAQITETGLRRVGADTTLGLQHQNADAKHQYQQGFMDKQGLDDKLHQQQMDANKQHQKDMEAWVQTLVTQMAAGGQVSAQGANAILTPLNQALKELGQKPVSLVSLAAAVQATNQQQANGLGAGLPTLPGTLGSQVSLPGSKPGAASGALYQIGASGQAGRDTVPLNVAGTPVMVGNGEQVAVFNRHQQPIVNMALSLLGYDGMAGLFSDVNTPNFLAGGGTIKTPHAVGGGAQGSLLNAAFRLLGKDANQFLKRHGHSSGAPGGAHHGASTSAGGQYDAGQLARLWTGAGGPANIAHLMAAIALAESGGNPTARNPSGASGLWQILGLPFPGNPFDPATNARMAVAKYMSQGLGAWVTYTSGAYRQFYSRGGQVARWFHAGGLHGGGASVAGGGPHLTDMQRIKNAMATITGLVGTNVGSGGDAGREQELLAYWPQLWSLYNPNLGQPASAYITTTDASGNPVSPVIDQQAVNLSMGQLTQELGWENKYVKDLGSARSMAQTWHPRVQAAIHKRRDEIAKAKAAEAAQIKALRDAEAKKVKAIKDKINANLRQIASYQRQITRLNNRISTEQGKNKPNYTAISGWRKEINNLQQKITDLEGQNQTLGGAGSYVGTGGEIQSTQNDYARQITAVQHTYDPQIKTWGSEITTLSGYSQALAAMPGTISGQSGVGGLLGPAKIQQHTLGSELAQLQPSALQSALAVAVAQYTASTTSGAPTGTPTSSSSTSNLASLLEQQNLMLTEQLAVSQAQYQVLANMPPFAGTFHTGGVVPGPVGAEVMAKLKAGEEVIPIGGRSASGSDVRVRMEDHRTRVWVDDVEQIVEQKMRKAASSARPRPGQRRGLITPLR